MRKGVETCQNKKTPQELNNKIFFVSKIKNHKKWTPEEDELLIKLAKMFNERNWKEIQKSFPKKTTLQCFTRYKRIRPGLIKGSWSPEEDEYIIQLVKLHGKHWSKIEKYLTTRNGKQIRERYLNVLDPAIKKHKFTKEEDLKIVQLYKKYGPKWSIISSYIEGRTTDMVKNRFHGSLKKKLEHLGNLIDDFIQTEFNDDERDAKSGTGHSLAGNDSMNSVEGDSSHNVELMMEDLAYHGSSSFEELDQTSNALEHSLMCRKSIETESKPTNVSELNSSSSSDSVVQNLRINDMYNSNNQCSVGYENYPQNIYFNPFVSIGDLFDFNSSSNYASTLENCYSMLEHANVNYGQVCDLEDLFKI